MVPMYNFYIVTMTTIYIDVFRLIYIYQILIKKVINIDIPLYAQLFYFKLIEENYE